MPWIFDSPTRISASTSGAGSRLTTLWRRSASSAGWQAGVRRERVDPGLDGAIGAPERPGVEAPERDACPGSFATRQEVGRDLDAGREELVHPGALEQAVDTERCFSAPSIGSIEASTLLKSISASRRASNAAPRARGRSPSFTA
jgi:hypothetical protein